MRSKTDLAESCGVEICKQGIVTDSRMQTNVPGIYAIGDCVESFCRIDQARANMLLATSAYRMGMIAGINAAGGEAHYKGVLNTFVSMVGEVEVAATGYNLQAAKDAGFENAKGVVVKGLIKPHFDHLDASKEALSMDLVIVMEVKGSMPNVAFPHKEHTVWLECANCHDAIFKPLKGANPMSMAEIMLGQKCGVCHGSVAFPVTECRRCHTESKKTAKK